MNIGIFYATYSGGTQAACEFLSQTLQGMSHQVTMKMISEVTFEDAINYDLIIFSSPTWDYEGKEGQAHQDFMTFMQNSAGKKSPGKNFAVLGLGDSSYVHFCTAVDMIEAFVKEAGGSTKESLKIDGYLFDTEKNNGHITEWAKKITS